MSEGINPADFKIVIVDDSDFSRGIMSKILLGAGYQVVGEASRADEALVVIHERKPDIVIADIVMPEISGIELAEKIRQKYDHIAVIIVSSLSQEHVVLEAIGAGASDFIAKPIMEQQLLDSLEKITHQLRNS